MTSGAALIHFGPYELDGANARLTRGGQALELPPRAFDLLRYLAERPGRLVGKDELLDEVWGRRFITEAVIKTVVSELRAALDDDAREPRYIETVPRRGYRFIGVAAPAAAPSAAPLPAAPTLGLPSTPLLGREHELAELAAQVRRHPLVTIAGPAGVGKTRLALAVAAEAQAAFADGAWSVELAAVPAGAGVASVLCSTIAQALRLPASAAADDGALAQALSPVQALVLLDNAEHLLDALAPLLLTLRARAPHLHLLLTSQEPLQLQDERLFRLAPLALPEAADEPDAAQLLASGAVRLFVERVAARVQGFALAPAQQQAVHDICRQLDGLPLALELAAARVPLLGVHGLLERLRGDDDTPRLDLLARAGRQAPARHHTLRDALQWSHALLSPAEQQVFRRLAVLRGSFALEMAQAVVADPGADETQTLDTLGALVDKSLVMAVPGTDPPRLRLLEAPRSLALEQLQGSGEEAALRARHAEATAQRLRQLVARTLDEGGFEWQDAAAPELPNLRAALAWAREQPMGSDTAGRQARELRVALAAWGMPLWHAVAAADEAVRAIDDAEAVLDEGVAPATRARLLHSIAHLAGNNVLPGPRGLEAGLRACALWRELGDTLNEYWVLNFVIPLSFRCGHSAGERAEALARMQALGDVNDPWRGRPLRMTLGAQHWRDENWPAFRDAMRQELALMRRIGDLRNAWVVASNLALALAVLGQLDEAIEVTATAAGEVRAQRRTRESWLVIGIHALCLLEARRTDADRAMREVLELQLAAGVRRWGHLHWPAWLELRGDAPNAARLLGWTTALARREGVVATGLSALVHQRTADALGEQIGADAVQALMAEGERLDDDAVITLLRSR